MSIPDYFRIDQSQSFTDVFPVSRSNLIMTDPGADGDCLLHEGTEITGRFFRDEVILSLGICDYQLGKGFIAHQADDTGNYPGFRGFVVPAAVNREYGRQAAQNRQKQKPFICHHAAYGRRSGRRR